MKELKELLDFTVRLIEEGHFWQVLGFLIVWNLPGIIAWLIQLTHQFQLKRVWEARCADKDKEIERLANNNKQLQNKLLKTKRP